MRFQKPSRYINGEVNSIKKDAPLKVALAFPDIYDIGMSHLGLRILYDVINRLPYASAERVFHPWLDMEGALRESKGALVSLEAKRPLSGFDIVGFSLQYELSYTSVLNMLSLGGIPIRAAERNAPIVIAGGPCTVNPLPMSPFIDAFLIGDGEEAVGEIIEAVYQSRHEGKDAVLKALSQIDGIYVPGIGKAAKRRFVASLDDAPYPVSPVVPYTQIVHDRLNLEVSRGCTKGCRFCQAGIIYRPLRQRSPQRVLEIAEKSLKGTGYEEVAFTSLSAGDYPALLPLMKEFKRRFGMVSVSLPSLRVKAVDGDILREIKSVRKTGFTIAPEAATDRLRLVINKDFSGEDYDRALEALFSEGWQNLKLYFMLGLPTETEADIEEIPRMAQRALKVAKRHSSRFVNISVSASPFVPKPHTPFQWCAQEDMEELRRKKDYLRGKLRKVNMRGHDVEMSMLEAAFARGDERLSALIEAAHLEGARLDGWTESFDFTAWLRAMDKTGVDAASYAKRQFKTDETLPWERIDVGVQKAFLADEYAKARSAVLTGDCSDECLGCGMDCGETAPVSLEIRMRSSLPEKDRPPIRVRARFSKTGGLRHLSHFELAASVTRALRRAGVRLEYTKGFHPAPKLAFGPPLGVGVSGLREYFDMVIIPGTALKTLIEEVNSALGDGLKIHEMAPVGADEPSLQDFISRYVYEIGGGGGMPLSLDALERFIESEEVIAEREKGAVDVRPMLEEARAEGDRVVLTLRDTKDKKVRLDEMAVAALGIGAAELEITRLSVEGFRGGQWTEPLEARREWLATY